MIPRYGEWDRKYRARGLTVVGVHSPETDEERDPKSVAAFARSHDLRWAVVLDPYLDAWRRYGVDAWPTVVLIDRQGVVRSVHIGDGRAPEIEADLRRLLGL
jgi:hypothetical protein